MYKSPDKSYLEQPQVLSDLVHSTKLIHKYLPKQVDIDMVYLGLFLSLVESLVLSQLWIS